MTLTVVNSSIIMSTKSTGFVLASAILIIYRLFLIFKASTGPILVCQEDHSKVFSTVEGTANTYGPCKNGVRVFFGADSKPTKTQIPCSAFDTDIFDVTSCVANKLSDAPGTSTHIIFLVGQILFLISAAIPFASTYTCFNAIFRIAGGFLNPYFIMTPAIVLLAIGELFDHPAFNKTFGKVRGANGRFLKE